MYENSFEYGPFCRGIYTALLWLTIVVGWHAPNMLIYYLPLLAFLGIGLRPFLVKTGIYRLYLTIIVNLQSQRDKKLLAKKRLEIDQKVRDEKYRQARRKDPKLPKNW